VTWVMLNLILVRLDTVLVSVQDRCMVCAKHTIGSGIFWTHAMVLLGDEAQVKAHFGMFRDSANLDTIQVNSLPQTYHRL
jgi:hypothetical protein